MENLFYLTIGDWAGDGHEKNEPYLVRSNKSVGQVREAHFRIKDATGIDIETICSGYGEDTIDQDLVDKIEALGFKLENSSGIGKEVVDVDEMARLWVFLLQKADPELELTFVKQPDYPDLHFYGYDDKGRHIGPVGYGLFQ